MKSGTIVFIALTSADRNLSSIMPSNRKQDKENQDWQKNS